MHVQTFRMVSANNLKLVLDLLYLSLWISQLNATSNRIVNPRTFPTNEYSFRNAQFFNAETEKSPHTLVAGRGNLVANRLATL